MANWYDAGKKAVAQASLNWGTTSLKILLLKSTYSFDKTKNHVSDISVSEISATNYARKAVTYPGTPVTQDDTAGVVRLFMSNLTWTTLGGASNDTIGGAAVYIDTGTDATSTLVFFLPTNTVTTAGNDVTLTPDATNGVATLT